MSSCSSIRQKQQEYYQKLHEKYVAGLEEGPEEEQLKKTDVHEKTCFDEIVDQFQIGLKRHNLFCKVDYNLSETVFGKILISNKSRTNVIDMVEQDEFVCIETDLYEREGPRYHVFVKHADKYFYNKVPVFGHKKTTVVLYEETFDKLVTIVPLEIYKWKNPERYMTRTPPQTSMCEGRTC